MSTFVKELFLRVHDGGLPVGDQDKHVAVQTEPSHIRHN